MLTDQRLAWSMARGVCHLNTTQTNSAILPPFWRFCYNVEKDPQEGTSCIYVDPVHQMPSGGLEFLQQRTTRQTVCTCPMVNFFFFLGARSDPCFVCPCKKCTWHAKLSMAKLSERPKTKTTKGYVFWSFDYVDRYCKEIERKKSTLKYVLFLAPDEGSISLKPDHQNLCSSLKITFLSFLFWWYEKKVLEV